jgi:hypothetical protein
MILPGNPNNRGSTVLVVEQYSWYNTAPAKRSIEGDALTAGCKFYGTSCWQLLRGLGL